MSSAVSEEKADYVVDWSGADDPENPRNWKKWTKNTQVICVSVFTLYSNLAAVMFAPGAPDLVAEFHITSTIVATFTVSIYVCGFVFGPFFVAPISEIYGRLWLYHGCNVVYIAFTIGCALSTNTAMFLVFRFICGCAASGPMTVGGGTIADIHTPEERGKAMAIFGLGPLLGPVIGPVIGGFVTQRLSWRWTFWLILILVSPCIDSMLAVLWSNSMNLGELRCDTRICADAGDIRAGTPGTQSFCDARSYWEQAAASSYTRCISQAKPTLNTIHVATDKDDAYVTYYSPTFTLLRLPVWPHIPSLYDISWRLWRDISIFNWDCRPSISWAWNRNDYQHWSFCSVE